METVLYVVHVIVCVALLPIILLQSGKGGGVSAAFGGGGAGTVFGSRGASTFLTKMTTGAAVVFMITSLSLSYMSKSSSVVANVAPVEQTDDGAVVPGADDPAADNAAAFLAGRSDSHAEASTFRTALHRTRDEYPERLSSMMSRTTSCFTSLSVPFDMSRILATRPATAATARASRARAG